MSQKDEALAANAPETMATAMRSIEEDIDFKPYLDAVNAGSSRTRSTVYVLVAMAVIILTGYRNTTSPDWLDKRLAKLQLASACVNTNANDCNASGPSLSPECTAAVEYSREFLFSEAQTPLLAEKEFCRELGEQISALIKVRTEALSIRLPFFGMVVDVNDLGLITGVFLAFILYVLYVGIDREIDNLNRAIRRAKTAKSADRRKESLELLLMTQVLAETPGPTYGVHILIVAVFVIYAFVFRTDLMTYPVAITLEGRFRGILETTFDTIVFLIVTLFCIIVWIKQRKLDIRVDDLISDLKELETSAPGAMF